MNINSEELIHAELEAIKNSVIMLHIDEFGKVKNRLLVLKKDIQHFKNIGYAENIKQNYDPQIGHNVDFRHLDFTKTIEKALHKAITKEFNFFKKLVYYFKRLFRMK